MPYPVTPRGWGAGGHTNYNTPLYSNSCKTFQKNSKMFQMLMHGRRRTQAYSCNLKMRVFRNAIITFDLRLDCTGIIEQLAIDELLIVLLKTVIHLQELPFLIQTPQRENGVFISLVPTDER